MIKINHIDFYVGRNEGSSQGIKIVDSSGRGSGGGQEGSVVKIKNDDKLRSSIEGRREGKVKKENRGMS